MDFEYAARNIKGVWRLAFGGPDWRDDLDISVDGVFRSFWAIAFAAPFSVLAFLSARRAALASPDFDAAAIANAPLAVILTADIVGIALDWGASIAALVFTARALGAQKQMAQMIVGFNWAQVIATIAVALPVAVLGVTMSMDLFVLLYLPAVGFALALLWGVLRKSLPLNVSMTVALIVMLTLIGVIINSSVTAGAVYLYHAFS